MKPFSALSERVLDVDPVAHFCSSVADLGIPSQYISTRCVRVSEAAIPHVLIDLGTADLSIEVHERRELRLPGSTSTDLVEERIVRSLSGPRSVEDNIRDALSELAITHYLNKGYWFKSTGLWSSDLPWVYEIDAKARWPGVFVVGVDAPPVERPALRAGPEAGPDALLGCLGLSNSGYGLFPCFAFRQTQDLIRIDRSRVRVLPNGRECLDLSFELGPLGGFYVQNNSPRLDYELFGPNETPIGEGSVVLSGDSLKYGINVPEEGLQEGVQISRARTGLFLQSIPVDWSDAYYLRSIKVNLEAR